MYRIYWRRGIMVAAKWGVALKKRQKSKKGEELLFLDPNTSTFGEMSRTKCINEEIITLISNSDAGIINEAAQDSARAELVEVVKEMMYLLEFDKHVEKNA
jgi:hypothetical protein